MAVSRESLSDILGDHNDARRAAAREKTGNEGFPHTAAAARNKKVDDTCERRIRSLVRLRAEPEPETAPEPDAAKAAAAAKAASSASLLSLRGSPPGRLRL